MIPRKRNRKGFKKGMFDAFQKKETTEEVYLLS